MCDGSDGVTAVLFDLDGVLVDSEHLWDRIRREVTEQHGGRWADGASERMMGMSTPEWAEYLVTGLGVRLSSEEVAETVIDRMAQHYATEPPTLPGAVETVRTVAERYPVAIASSAPPRIIGAFLETGGLTDVVRRTVSSEQVGAGKPAPDVYLRAADELGVDARRCVAVEDSSNGLRSAAASGATVVAVPNPHFPPAGDALRLAERRLERIDELPGVLTELSA
ncbi:haloacid dehalogenase superfamily, subfamily IA, variant 3 with third motif having DD or ED [Actinopolyspora lacussalsi subsp. righensis]|uniref:Haloacid dehalogenase superfamily, subfamily IA, variant 3 with third motif having DD or ED n=1 Tax=Actinopolyspora righensis TaxID=995060 RepID=A0A1I6ZI37_9ACTN|nr:HAD family phosphatase [Actinopolyspora righensis]SFT62301.1 haloacid dehalogenase superfamily, subfamily IA, variant 3 with third motif having DD or ED [Actinopolyspora righensis]